MDTDTDIAMATDMDMATATDTDITMRRKNNRLAQFQSKEKISV